jgi:hypothetical protein
MCAALGVLGALIAAQTAPAQTVRGTVTLPDSATPVGGVLVVGIGANGAQGARTLTSQRGVFTLRFPNAGTYRLQILRIGYRPMIGPTVTIAADEAKDVRVVYVATPVVLSAVNVRDRQTCRVTADTGLGVARVWEEARKAMLMSQTTSADAPLMAEWIEYDRSLDSTARLVRSQRVHTTRAPTTHAFRAVPIAQLDTGGYITIDASGTSYFAPDAEVLLSDVFIRGHCFRLDDSRRREGLLGVRFEPSSDRSEKREIAGTMWLDRTSAELRTVDFTYTNLPDVAKPIAGGAVEFMRLGEGSWLVKRWSLNMPRMERVALKSGDALRRTIMTMNGIHVTAVQVAGGEVTQINRGDSTLYIAIGPRVDLQVTTRDAELSPVGAVVKLDGTDYSGVADEAGRVLITPVLAGRYRATIVTPLMAAVGMPAVGHEIEARVGEHVDTIALPRARDLLASACPRDSVRNGEGMVHGFVRDASGRRVPGAAVTVTWQENFAITLMGGDRVQYNSAAVGAISDSDGRWQACGIPRDRMLIVEVVTDSGADKLKVRLEPNQPFKSVDLVLHPVTAAAAQDVLKAMGASEHPKAVVEFTVYGSQGQILPNTVLDVADEAGMRRTLTTGPGGKALAAAVSPGVLSVLTRHIGYAPGKISVSVVPGRNTLPIILNENAAPMLDTVRVVGARTLYGLQRNDEFEQRRAMKLATVSFNETEIDVRNPTDVSDMLRGVPSVKLAMNDKYGGMVAMSTRSMNLTPDLEPAPCFMAVMVDGIIQNPQGGGYDLRLLPRPKELHGIEVFAGGASIPLKYAGSGSDKWCGMIAVWTK